MSKKKKYWLLQPLVKELAITRCIKLVILYVIWSVSFSEDMTINDSILFDILLKSIGEDNE